MINQMDVLDWSSVFNPFLVIFMLIILMIFMVIIYKYVKIWLMILVIFLFSIIIGINSMTIEGVPLNPYFSIFFILFQSVFFIKRSMEVKKL